MGLFISFDLHNNNSSSSIKSNNNDCNTNTIIITLVARCSSFFLFNIPSSNFSFYRATCFASCACIRGCSICILLLCCSLLGLALLIAYCGEQTRAHTLTNLTFCL